MHERMNGPASEKRRAPKRGERTRAADPLAAVLVLGPRIPVAVMVFAAVLAVSLHAGAAVGAVQAAVLHAFASWARDVRGTVAANLAQTYDIDFAKPIEKPEEPPPPPPEPVKEEPKPVVKEQPKDEPPPPPPAAADAQKVLMAEPAKDEPVDLTGDNSFLNGNSDTLVGGKTQIGGKATKPTDNAAAVATGTPGGTGTAAAPAVKVDRSRKASLVNKANLERCPFPAEADAEQVDQAEVIVEIHVTADGRAESVGITKEPGHGFGREARRCALREKYVPALNVDGAPIAAVYPVRFTFSR